MFFKMNIVSLNKNVYNIQKCLLPDCKFVKKNYGKFCFVTVGEKKFIVKIGLSEFKTLRTVVFIDNSVTLLSSLQVPITGNYKEITTENLIVLKEPRPAKVIETVIVFRNFLDAKKYQNSNGNSQKIIREILKLFVVCSKTCVFLGSLSSSQNFGIYALIINNIGNTNNQIFITDCNTKIKITKYITKVKFQQTLETTNICGFNSCSKAYSILKEAIELSKYDNNKLKLVKKILVVGPAGCGKTSLVENVAKNCECVLLKLSANHVNSLSLNDQQKMLENICGEAEMYSAIKECCVILLDDVDLMSFGKSVSFKQFIRHLITILKIIEKVPNVIVIVTSSSVDKIDSELRKLFEEELEIEIPTIEERQDIIKNILSFCKINFNDDILYNLAKWTPGFVCADIRLLILEGLIIFNKKKVENLSNDNLLLNSFKEALTKVIPSAMRGAIGLCIKNDTIYSQIGGLENVKKVLDLSVRFQLENPMKFHKLGVPLTKGILLYGPPGCAKTTLVKALAKQCNTTFLATSAADLYSPFVGDAEKKIVQLFTQARIGSPSILFIDEIDAVVGSKSSDNEKGVHERILSTLLVEMDGVGLNIHTQQCNLLESKTFTKKETNNGVIVIGATNKPQLLDSALKRPGRFDRLLYVPPPNELERLRILFKLTEKMPLHECVDLKLLAKFTNFYSGADLKNLCQESGLYALQSSEMSALHICQNHFEHILSQYKPSLNEKIISSYESFQKYNI